MRLVELRRGWMLIIGVFLLFMLAGLFSAKNDRKTASRTTSGGTRWLSSNWLSFSQNTDTITNHPITTLMKDAKVAFTNRLAKQSKTLPEAVAEYKRRYGRDPPRGFDHWWEFAKERDFKLVDEFDAIDEDLAPFWTLSGEELRWRTYLLGHLPSITLVRIQDGNVSEISIDKTYVDTELGYRSRGFRELLEKFLDKLPNMDLAINTKAEGRVLVPWEHLQFPNLTLQAASDDMKRMLDDFTPDWEGLGGVWEAYRYTCPPGTPARQLYGSYRDPNVGKPNARLDNSQVSDDPFAFVKSVNNDYDFCENPWAHYAQAKGFADIRIPSHYYLGLSASYTYAYDRVTENVKEIDDMEVPWDRKRDIIFWRGATTGGGSTPPGFTPAYQRHRYFSPLNLSLDSLSYTSLRFVRMAHESAANNVTIVHALPSRPDTFISTTVPAQDLNNDIMDAAFVSAVGEYPGGEEELRKVHRFAGFVPLGKHWSYKYLIDLDGMSYSARFMAFLASDSAVLKSTVYKEYFSDWIQPWLHYIPVSSMYSEIYNIHAYFSGPSASTLVAANVAVPGTAEWEAVKRERDAQLRQIAKAGKQWKQTVGRRDDMEGECHILRLSLWLTC
ncbi:glycosyltransferase family 90 protein [Boletus reticuloceps]|uniref:Glycosyltransferase family 90 protein n=1 Tax=Boletus reticuloceps TaxID=495285 RepID=A0A8I2Z0E7_9AGAM|nr:glycosyltransferase family 90 protein [Boletus reticuloceps]